MPYFLEITLLSPLTSASGSGWGNQIDTDICYDAAGLLVVPGRRLKGLLRDALRDVIDAFAQCDKTISGDSTTIADRVFGVTGAGLSGQAKIRVNDALLRDFTAGSDAYQQIHQLVAAGVFTHQEVAETLSSVFARTAIEPRSGTARENTLRFARAANRGLVFKAEVAIDDEKLIPLVALAAAAVQEMGLGRSRGAGEVQVRFIDENNADLTEQWLKEMEEKGLQELMPQDATSAQVQDVTKRSKDEQATSKSETASANFLRYRLTLIDRAILPEAGLDVNSLKSSTYIPGGNLLGSFAALYLGNNGGDSAAGNDFKRLFLQGKVMFLNAYPEARDDSQRRLLPPPHSLRKAKKDDELFDLATTQGNIPPVQRIANRYIAFGETIETQEIATVFSYHHARATDRRYGRALGDEVEKGGAIFSFEALEQGQCFQGAFLGAADDLRALQQLLPNGGGTIRVGKSKSAEYGRVHLEWLDTQPEPVKENRPEWNNWQKTMGKLEETNTLTITCLAPLLSTNQWGQPAPCFPVEELVKNLLGFIPCCKKDDVIPAASWVRTKMVGGFLGHLKLPAAQWPAIDAGSVFQFILPNPIQLDQEARGKLESAGLGFNRQAGFGRIAVNLHGLAGKFNVNSKKIQPINPPPPPSNLPLASTSTSLVAKLLARRAAISLEEEAIRLAAKAKQIPTASTLYRVALLLRRDDWVTATPKEMGRFKDKATNALADCRLDGTSLQKLTIETLDNSMEKGQTAFKNQWSHGSPSLNQLVQEEGLSSLCESEKSSFTELTRQYLQALYRQLAYRKRQEHKQPQNQKHGGDDNDRQIR